ncbi:MAG: flagellar hook-basal body complex protein [Bacillota bacterium]
MLRALWAAASGMVAQQTAVDVISHNLANVNSPGFKATRVEFGDVVATPNPPPPTGESPVGAGVRVVATMPSFLPGQLEETGQPLDLAIHGPGFFQVELENGDILYTRSGSFHMGSDRRIYNSDGHQLVVSSWDTLEGVDAGSIHVDTSGRIQAQAGGASHELGQVTLVTFPNPAGLQAVGGGLYRQTDASGEAETGSAPGEIWQGFLERANVQVVEEMVGLIMAQRAYEMNSKVVQAADDMLGMANNLRR